jgi:hypothetical protein
MVKRGKKLSEGKRLEKIRNLAFKICEALNDSFDVFGYVRLFRALTFSNKEGFFRLYSFQRSRYFKNGFIIEYYGNNLSFREVNDIMPFMRKSKLRSTTYFYVVLHSLSYALKRHKKINLEVRGKESFEMTIFSKDLSLIPILESTLETKIV